MMKIKKLKLSKLNSNLNDEYDLFICSSSFEERCLRVPEKIKRKRIHKKIIVYNAYGSEIIKEKSDQIAKILSDATLVPINFDNPLEMADLLMRDINSIKGGKKLNVLIDVTTFTHELLLLVLKLLGSSKKIRYITCVYVNALAYNPQNELENKWLSHGCSKIRSVLGYSGMLLPSLKTHLIILVGYEYSRAFDVICAVEPNSISLIYGASENATTQKDQEANSVFKKLIEDMAFEYLNIESSEIPCDNPEETAKILASIYERHAEENIIVVPMNNKLSTIGVALSVADNENIQLCYAPAIIYNEEDYSVPGDYCYIYEYKEAKNAIK